MRPIVLLSFLLLLSCSGEKKSPKSLALMWQQKSSWQSDELARSVASVNGTSMCLQSNFNVPALKAEIANYEKTFSNKSSTAGVWRHLELSMLPFPQAQFLRQFGDKIGDLQYKDSINYSGCGDLPCIFNRIYKRGDDYIGGYVHYLWYLKFGSYLAADNSIPSYDYSPDRVGTYGGRSWPLSAYLFNDAELYGLWRVTHLLKEPYTTMTLFRELQRLPRGASFENASPLTCGIASSIGNVFVSDGCLKIDNLNNDDGFLYIGVVHEMTHILDYHEARTRYVGKTYRSFEPDYTNVAGFYREEYTDANGKLVYQWKVRPGAKAIREYATASPAESFADTLAYFRQSGNETKSKIAHEHFSWVSRNYFANETYDTAGNRSRLIKQHGSVASRGLLGKVVDCSKNSKPYHSDYFSMRDFSDAQVAPWMLRCLGHEAQEIAAMITARVKIYEPDGCGLLTRTEKRFWDQELKEYLKSQFAVYVNEMAKDPKYLEKIGNLDNIIGSRQYANEAIYACYQGSSLKDMSSCYQEKISLIISEIGVSLRLPEDQSMELVRVYGETHPYSVVVSDLFSSFKGILDQNTEMIESETQHFWQMCVDAPADDTYRPRGKYFSPVRGYAISSIVNCINDGFPSLITQITRSLELEGQKVTHSKEEEILIEFLQPRISDLIADLHLKATAEEKVELAGIAKQYYDGIRQDLLGDFSWITTLNNQNTLLMSCRDYGLKKIDYLPRFHVKREVFGNMLSSEVCRDILQDPTFIKFIESSKSRIEAEVYSRIDKIFNTAAEERALHCKTLIPWKWERTRATVRIPRQACLTMGWKDVEETVVNELMRSSDLKKLKLTTEELKAEISSRAPRIRAVVEEKHF